MISVSLLAQGSPSSARPEIVVTEGLQANGALSWNVSMALTAILIVLAIGWLMRQRELLGTPTTVLLSLLRIVVIVVAVWMVVQPSWTRTETISRRAEVVVLADGSGSMDTIDPPQTALSDDWQLAISEPDHALAKVQRVQLDLQMATRTPVADNGLIDRAIAQLTEIRDSDQGLVDTCLVALRSASDASQQWTETEDRAERMALMASRADAIDSALVELDTLRAALNSQRLGRGSDSRQSRKEYVARLLARFEEQLDQLPGNPVSLRRAVFSDHVQPIESNTWTKELAIGEQSSGSIKNTSSERTDVSAALSFVRSIDPAAHLAAVLMLSEGQHNSASRQTPVEAAAGLAGTPVFTVAIGDQARRRDIAIHRVNAPAIVYQDDRPVIEAVISSYECEGDEVEVVLFDGEQKLQTKTIRFPAKISDVAVEFRLQNASLGRKQYRLEVEAVDEETSLQNNQAMISIQTIKSKLYVLIADRQPRWEYRYLEQLFRRDNRVELDKLLLMPTLKTTLSSSTNEPSNLLPTTIDGWSKFDVVILGDLPPEVMTPEACEAMGKWINAGGNLIVVAGEYSMPIAYRSRPWFELLPITNQPTAVSAHQRPTPAPEGYTHPSIRLNDSFEENRDLWQRWMSGPVPGFVSPFHTAKPTASVLASLSSIENAETDAMDRKNDDSRPAWLCVHRVSSGKVAYLSSPVSYRLRIRAGDTYHHRFWGQLVRWMTSADLSSGDGMVDIKSDRSIYDEGQRSGIRVRLSDASGIPVRRGDVRIELSAAGDHDDEFQPRTLKLVENETAAGVYELTLDRLPAGVYQATAIGPTIETLRKTSVTGTSMPGSKDTASNDSTNERSTTTFTVQSAGDVEHLMTEADPLLLSQIAEASGGLRIFPAALEEVLHVISLAPDVTTTQRVTPLWNRWSNLWVILGCLTTDWWIRRRKGLV